MHIVAVSYSWLSTETLSSSSPLITSHQPIRKDALKMWSRAPSGDESWVLAAAQLQAWKHLCKTTGTPAQFRRVCFLERIKTIVGLSCLKLCDGIHQELGFPLCVVSSFTPPRFPPVLSHFCSSALVVSWLIFLVQPHRCESQHSGQHTQSQRRYLKVQSKCLNRKGRATWMIH